MVPPTPLPPLLSPCSPQWAFFLLTADAFLAMRTFFPLSQTPLFQRCFGAEPGAPSFAALPNSWPGLRRCFSTGLSDSWRKQGLIGALLLESDVVSFQAPSPEGVPGFGYRYWLFYYRFVKGFLFLNRVYSGSLNPESVSNYSITWKSVRWKRLIQTRCKNKCEFQMEMMSAPSC